MIDKFEYAGVWYLPDKPDLQLCGTLRFTPEDGAVLKLIGSFRDPQANLFDIKSVPEPEIILGVATDGTEITLHESYETQFRLGLPHSVPSCSFRPHRVFVGARFETSEDIKFKAV